MLTKVGGVISRRVTSSSYRYWYDLFDRESLGGAGLSIQPLGRKGRVPQDLLLKPASAFKWSKEAEPTQAQAYLRHIDKHLMYDRDEYQLHNAQPIRFWLTVDGGLLADCRRWALG